MSRALPHLRLAAALAGLYACGCVLGLALLVAAFRLGVLASLDILFYRGLVVIALSAIVTFAILAAGIRTVAPRMLGVRDAVAATLVSLSLSVSFLVVVPVTVDRSISIFLLGEMAEGPEAGLTPDEASRLFKSVYVDEDRQIGRRLAEQTVSGNLEKAGDGYRITPRGRLVVEIAKTVAWLFDSRAGLASPRERLPPASAVAERP